jgi:hypothetical protein
MGHLKKTYPEISKKNLQPLQKNLQRFQKKYQRYKTSSTYELMINSIVNVVMVMGWWWWLMVNHSACKTNPIYKKNPFRTFYYSESALSNPKALNEIRISSSFEKP